MKFRNVFLASAGLLTFVSAVECRATEETSREAIVERVREDIKVLASDELQGRGVETEGIEVAAKRIIDTYEKAGLKPGMPDGSWRQSFPVVLGDEVITEKSKVELTGPDGSKVALKLKDEFQPIRRGTNGEASGGLAFVGYGISSEEDKYDDYAGIDVAGKVVIMIRREPKGPDGNAFRGSETSTHAFVDRKMELLAKSKAAAVLLVNNDAGQDGEDELSAPSAFGNQGESVPFAHVKRSVVDSILKKTPLKAEGDKTLDSLEAVTKYIDETLKPVSQELAGWKVDIATQFETKSISTDNIIGVVEGEGPLADETIVIGAHYDHLGFGGYGSRAQNRTGEVHNGADDNASGTAAVMELARRFGTGPKPKRRMVFICFSGEERGLIGSEYYVKNPVFPLENTVTMINFDMIGNLKDNRVEVNGVGTAAEFEAIAKKADEVIPVDITIVPGAFAGSDHLPFYRNNIPVMFCFTGMTSIYHTPDDDFETLNIEGAVTVIDYTEQLLRGIDALEKRPTFASSQPRGRRPVASRTPFLGIQPDLAASGSNGIVLRGVRDNSPAQKAGLQTGDVITMVGETKMESYANLIEILVASKPGDKLTLKFKRAEAEMTVEVELEKPRGG